MPRKALLLGLDNYQDTGPHDLGLKLDAPRNDVALIAETLEVLGVRSENIIQCLSSNGPQLTTSNLRRQIQRFIRDSAQIDDELVIYLSGHGIDQDGQRLILPVDYYRDDPQAPSVLMGDHWLFGIARVSPAKSVLLVLDTCREGVKIELAPDIVGKSGTGSKSPSPMQSSATVAILYSCHPSERSWATDGSAGLSYFALALSEVLKTEERVATLNDVVAAVNGRLAEILPPDKTQACYLDERQVEGRAGPVGELIVKEDKSVRLRQKIDASRWCHMLEVAPYWSSVAGGSSGLGLQLKTLALRAEEMMLRARRGLPQDRWRSDAALKRFLDGLEQSYPGREETLQAQRWRSQYRSSTKPSWLVWSSVYLRRDRCYSRRRMIARLAQSS